jgi:hypothetical protein
MGTVNNLQRVAILGLGAGLVLLAGGCNTQRTLFRDTDVAASRKVGYFGSYDSETAHAAAERRKKNDEWGFGPPALMGGGGGQ